MEEFIIDRKYTLKDALKKMDQISNKILFVAENKVLLGTVSDGDIRRSILRGDDFGIPVTKIMNLHPIVANTGYDDESIKDLMIKQEIQAIPIVDNHNEIIDIKFWHKLFDISQKEFKKLDIPAVIMAGGRGSRLEPFTKILPKPLIPVGDKSIIELILDEYEKFGIQEYYLSINYKAKLIKSYFEENEKKYNIAYIEEEKPLGTAGSLHLLNKKLKSDFIVSNCDIIIKDDYTKIYDFHKNGNYSLTLVASIKHHTIPYGVCQIGNGGDLIDIVEKPEYDFFVNTGMYILNPEIFDYIPLNKFYHITHLINDLKKAGKKIGVFPVSEKSWIDIGQWNEYKKNLNILENLLNK